MPARQVWIFRFGCWAALVAAVVHLAGHMAGPPAPANDTERQLLDLASTYRFAFPGGAEQSLMDLMRGFSLSFSVLLATIGGTGLVVAKRGYEDEWLMAGVARAAAVSSVALLAISLTFFFIIPSLFIALVAVAFVLASVRK